MKLNRNYAAPADMPATMPLFPLDGALLLPRRPMQLTVFEPRYLAMLDDALTRRAADRRHPAGRRRRRRRPSPELFPVGCAGRIVQYAEIGDGRCFLTLMGVARFRIAERNARRRRPIASRRADYAPFAEDFTEGAGETAVDRKAAGRRPARFAEANEVKVDWDDIKKASNEALVNAPVDDEPLRRRERSRRCSRRATSSRAPRFWSRSRRSSSPATPTRRSICTEAPPRPALCAGRGLGRGPGDYLRSAANRPAPL